MAALDEAFAPLADPERARTMAAYLRDQFAFLGIAAGPRRQAQKAALAELVALGRPSAEVLEGFARSCWERPEREFQYAGCDAVRRWIGRCDASFLVVLADLIVTKPWWDTVDSLAVAVGALAERHPELEAELDRWNGLTDLWMVRVSIIAQLGRRERTDAGRLYARCAAQAGHRDFFVRKAIGWALRDYARTDPAGVRSFVAAHPELSGLSVREALKHLGR